MSESQPTLAEELESLNTELASNISEDVLELMRAKAVELKETGIARGTVGRGDVAPDFKLHDSDGDNVQLEQLLMQGPVVLCFYRGGWCPYCNLQLQWLQRYWKKFQTLGARLVAISPQTPDASAATVTQQGLGFDVLSDLGNEVARKYRLVFTLPEELRPVYERFNIDIPASNGDQSYELPLAATYVVDTDGRIVYAFVNCDYTKRAEPEEILAVLRELAT